MEELKEKAYRYAIKNAFLHKGQADARAVVGKVIALEKGMPAVKIMPIVEKIVEEVNSLSFGEIEAEYHRLEGSYELKPKEKKEGLPDLEWAAGEKVVTRYAPNPNGAFHLGNARAAYMSYAFAEKYAGKFILRFDDTDPKVKKPIANAKELFLEDLEWLGCKVDTVCFASDRLDIYYNFMRKAIMLEKAYACTCETEAWRAFIKKKQACPCRELKAEEHMERFQKMLSHKYKEGQAVLRIKTDLQHKDPSIRDWWAAKIVDSVEHPNPRAANKHVWPSYNFASAIDDHELGVTLIIRGQEHEQNATKQKFLYNYFGWQYAHCFHHGRVKLEGIMLSTSAMQKQIAAGKFFGYEDPRLGTIRAFRRRGITAQALREMLLQLGVKASDTTISIDALYDLNRKAIDNISDRIAFAENPCKLEVHYCPKHEAKMPVHPDFPEKGEKTYLLAEGTQKFFVPRKEIEEIKTGNAFRLRNAYNAKITSRTKEAVIAEFAGIAKTSIPIVHWVSEGMPCEVMMQDAKKAKGLVESYALRKKIGEHLYFEKFGYVRLDQKIGDTLYAWFSHK